MTTTNDEIQVVKTASCNSLSGKTALTYEIGAAGADVYARVTHSSGSGTFSKDWVALSRVHAALEKNGAKPITLATLGPLFKGLSANTAGFLLAVLKHEGLVRAAEDQARAYERTDGKAFFTEVTKLIGRAKVAAPGKSKPTSSSSVAVKAAPPAKRAGPPEPDAKTAASRPAVYVSEVHGPLVPEPRKPAKKAPTKR
jgi:hypothetical protein